MFVPRGRLAARQLRKEMAPPVSVIPTMEESVAIRRAKAAAAFLGLITVARVFPAVGAPLARYGLGITVEGAAGSGVGATALSATNVLPQPFGFVPPQDYGLSPNFYLPSGIGTNLPSIVPGAAEQRAEQQAIDRVRADAKAQAQAQAVIAIQVQRGTPQVEAFIAAVETQGALSPYDQPGLIISGLQAELARRERDSVVFEAARVARLATGAGGSVPTNPQQVLPQGASPQGAFTALVQRAADASFVPATPTVAPNNFLTSGQGVANQSGQSVPGGFVAVPGPGSNLGGASGSIKNNNQGSFIDVFIAEQNNDPWPMG